MNEPQLADGLEPLRLLPNVRAERPDAEVGYLWGKPAERSNILRGLHAGQWVDDPSRSAVCRRLGIGPGYLVAERWIASDDREYPSMVATASGTERPFYEFLEDNPPALLGPDHAAHYGAYLGCVMKLLDTHDALDRGGLSVQVHPPEGYLGRPAKPEMWKGHGKIYLGWRESMTEAQVEAAVQSRAVEKYLNDVELAPDDLILVPGGLVHAIRAGTFTAEWSMAPVGDGDLSRATATLFDGTDGRAPRPGKESVEDALDIMRGSGGLTASAKAVSTPHVLAAQGPGNVRERLFATSQVFVEQWRVATRLACEAQGRGIGVFIESGVLTLSWGEARRMTLTAGDECFLPAALGPFVLESDVGALAQAWYTPSEAERTRAEV